MRGAESHHPLASEEVAHRHGGGGGIPVHVGGGAGFGEADVLHHVPRRFGVRHPAGVQADIDQNAVRPPEGVMQLDEPGVRCAVDFLIDAELLAPERPAFVKDGVREHAAQVARMTVLHDELQVVTGISFVRAGQFQAEVLGDFGPAPRFVPRVLGQIVDPENAGLIGIEGSGCAVGGGRELLP